MRAEGKKPVIPPLQIGDGKLLPAFDFELFIKGLKNFSFKFIIRK